MVYRGKFGERDVAVKILHKDLCTNADKEASILRISDDHPNVIKYFSTEEDDKCIYIALQLCDADLKQFIEGKYENPNVNKYDILKDALEGICHLHALNIIHRDVKPSNVLIRVSNNRPRGIIADLGLSKKLQLYRNEVSHSFKEGAGTRGWMAPEMLKYNKNSEELRDHSISLKADIFSCGCLIFYVHSNGGHPFGEDINFIDVNILNNEYCLDNLQGKEHCICVSLIEQMLRQDPTLRPCAKSVLRHPLFWSAERRKQYFMAVNTYLNSNSGDVKLLSGREKYFFKVIGCSNWLREIETVENINLQASNQKVYNGSSIKDLITAISDYAYIQSKPLPGITSYSEDSLEKPSSQLLPMFRCLLLQTYEAMEPLKLHDDLRDFYDNTYNFGKNITY